ncbi:unnamed protein product [Mytilus coruscus]|uniref:Uncharacterized protein n=1 Tax=Mytilus coruscus TaxID=42192 RepID=A0A6J8CNV8_MYTCO|nr:unnamed protein product [Mytilus coruscus]
MDTIRNCATKYQNIQIGCTFRTAKIECKKYCGVCPDAVITASSSRETTNLYQNILRETTTLTQGVITSEKISVFPTTHVLSTSHVVDIAETTPIYVSTTKILPSTVDRVVESSTDYNSKIFIQYIKPSSSDISLPTPSLSDRLNTSQSRTTDTTDISTFSGINRLLNTATPVVRIHGHCPCTCKHGFNWTALSSYSERQDLRKKLIGKLEETDRELKITKKTLSAYVRSKISARDNRTSSVVMGTVGSIVIGLVVIFIIFLDLFPSYKPTRNRIKSL